MLKLCALLISISLIASAASSHAAPPDSPDTVYIDGLPCNRACQSYMAWPRRVLSEQAAPASQPASSQHVQPSPKNGAQLTTKIRAKVKIAKRAAPKVVAMPPTNVAEPSLVNRQEAKPADKPDSSPVANPTFDPDAGTKLEQAASAPAAENSTTGSPASDSQMNGIQSSLARPSANPPANAETTAPAPSGNADQKIAIVLARPEIRSASDLANKVVAIDVSQSNSITDVRSAIAAAGASDVQISAGESLALMRVMDGEVPAAVVDLLSPEAAESWNAGIKGFNTIRIPISPPSRTGG